jgi:hypothetical protein
MWRCPRRMRYLRKSARLSVKTLVVRSDSAATIMEASAKSIGWSPYYSINSARHALMRQTQTNPSSAAPASTLFLFHCPAEQFGYPSSPPRARTSCKPYIQRGLHINLPLRVRLPFDSLFIVQRFEGIHARRLFAENRSKRMPATRENREATAMACDETPVEPVDRGDIRHLPGLTRSIASEVYPWL